MWFKINFNKKYMECYFFKFHFNKNLFNKYFTIFLFHGVFFFLLQSHSAPLSEVELFLNQSQIEHKRLHQLCYSFFDSTPGLPCNPSFLGLRQKSRAWIYGYGNNNLGYFQDVSDIINGPINPEKLLEIIDHNSNEHFIAGSSIGYVANNWGFNLIPSKLILYTKIRNPALPRITLLASKEEEAQLQFGSFLNSEWSWGIQFRAIHRRYSFSDSYFSDHLVDGSNELYKIKSQQSYFIEPSILYAPEDIEWNPTFNLMIDQLGHSDNTHPPYNLQPNLRMSASASNDLHWGHLSFGVSTQWMNLTEKQKLYSSIGGQYQLNPFEFFCSFSEIEKQFGVGLNLKIVTTALSYSQQDWSQNLESESYSLWRWDLGFVF